MFLINRSVAIIKPKQPYIDWVNSVEDEDEQFAVADFSTDCNVILLPETDSDEHAKAVLKEMCLEVFEIELSCWITDDTMWPENITYKMFQEWFDVEFHSMVFDPFQDDIEKEPYWD